MAKERNLFAVSITVSAVWHLFWMSIVGIAITPNITMQDEFTKVTFLGPILEKTAFEMMIEESKPPAETFYRASLIKDTEVHLDIKGPDKIANSNAFVNVKEGAPFDRKKLTHHEKDKPCFILGSTTVFYHAGTKGLNRFIDGPAKNRLILFQPSFPYFSKKSIMEEEDFITKFRFILSGEGNVEFVEPIVSSGYPDVDMRCVKYLKQWKFAPQYMSESDDKQWGVVTLNIRMQ